MSYWENDEAVAQWAQHPLHQEAKRLGHAVWYEAYRTMVCTVDHHRLKA
jgi:heme-degrading monooxygenase HmoA